MGVPLFRPYFESKPADGISLHFFFFLFKIIIRLKIFLFSFYSISLGKLCTIKDLGIADRMCMTQKFCLIFMSETISAICLEFGFILNIAKKKKRKKRNSKMPSGSLFYPLKMLHIIISRDL